MREGTQECQVPSVAVGPDGYCHGKEAVSAGGAAWQSQQYAKAKQIEKEAEGPASSASADSSRLDPARPTTA